MTVCANCTVELACVGVRIFSMTFLLDFHVIQRFGNVYSAVCVGFEFLFSHDFAIRRR